MTVTSDISGFTHAMQEGIYSKKILVVGVSSLAFCRLLINVKCLRL